MALDSPDRRKFIKTAAISSAAAPILATAGTTTEVKAAESGKGKDALPIYKSLKIGMARVGKTMTEKFKIVKDLGYHGIELNSPGGVNKKEALKASEATGLPIHGVVCSTHWNIRLSDPKAETREKGLENLKTAIRNSHAVGGSSVLLVPGVVNKTATQQQCWDRSLAQIRKALPLASKLGIHILIENVWNRFCYKHGGPPDQSAELLAKYIDAAESPWVGSYFDIGNHRRYGKPEEWIRTLGKRIVKLDVKDWGGQKDRPFLKRTWNRIGDGDVDWAAVRKALAEINFTGWSTAEVGGGGKDRLADINARMDRVLYGKA